MSRATSAIRAACAVVLVLALAPVAGADESGRIRVGANGLPLEGETALDVHPDAILGALRAGDAETAERLTRRLREAAASGRFTIVEPSGTSYPFEVASVSEPRANLEHILRNGVVMRLALEWRKDPERKKGLAAYERLVGELLARDARVDDGLPPPPLPAPRRTGADLTRERAAKRAAERTVTGPPTGERRAEGIVDLVARRVAGGRERIR